MKRKFIGDDEVTLKCTTKEASDLWYAVEQTLSSMEAEGLQGVSVYARLKALAFAFGKGGASDEETVV